MSQERLSLDTRLWLPRAGETPDQAKTRAETDLAFALREQRETNNLAERTNFYVLFLDEDGDLYHPLYGKLKDHLRKETRIDLLENEAFEELSEWARKNDQGNAIWISPPSKEIGYTESRMIIFELKINEKGEKQITCKSICTQHAEEECLEIAERLMPFTASTLIEIESSDDLRANPIFFEPTFDMEATDFLSQLIDLPEEVWENTRQGENLEELKETRRTAKAIVDQHYSSLLHAQTYLDFIRIGAGMELDAARSGNPLQMRGSCGRSNTDVLSGSGIFDIIFSDFSIGLKTGSCYEFKWGTCKICGQVIPVGPCGICRFCERGF